MPKTYSVVVPITGICCVEVEAGSEEEAIELAMASEDLKIENIEQWECHERIVQGNVFYGMQNEIEVELIDDGED